jgi:uncharacterized protein (DUF1778 family)
MTATARFDLKMDIEEKAIVSRAASLLGTTMASFVRIAAKEKAQALLNQEMRITISNKDFESFVLALNGEFAPNPALKKAMNAARKITHA